ncbi:MAG: hypothetical protein CUN50_00545 [Candidatus Thermofonsia Clade 1 bacterium]|uniref:Bacterial transcriptional activator domain-containing protein n=1 Tax=Candidatus Thermofonsia Clade 1 bacterium TaxID=2364210 RepID=A0A2M8Q0W1_9CHLR|nr:MAG: hypothetical protein CUN50_00545 [Candidatus Thermofonsia Clade 1 bacterium]
MLSNPSIALALSSSAQFIVLHPNYRKRYHLLSSALTNSAFSPIYLDVHTKETTWQQFWQLLSQAYCEQAALHLPEPSQLGSPEVAASYLCNLLATRAPHLLILDSSDNLQPDSCRSFFAALVERLPQPSKVILIGRTWLAELLGRASHNAVICYPTAEAAMLHDYSTIPADRHLLEVYAHADGRIVVDGVESKNWEGQLPRALFYFFIDRGMVTRDAIFQSFWSELSEREATNVFHVTKRKIHEMLGFNLTVYCSGYYHIAPEIDLRYDSQVFLNLIQQGESAEPEEGIPLLESAIRLYRSDFLRGLKGQWIEQRRDQLRAQMAEACAVLGRFYEQTERDLKAINAYERALAIQPYREEWARPLMSLYAMHRQPKRGLAVFERLEAALLKQNAPADKPKLDKRTQDLAAKLRRML